MKSIFLCLLLSLLASSFVAGCDLVKKKKKSPPPAQSKDPSDSDSDGDGDGDGGGGGGGGGDGAGDGDGDGDGLDSPTGDECLTEDCEIPDGDDDDDELQDPLGGDDGDDGDGGDGGDGGSSDSGGSDSDGGSSDSGGSSLRNSSSALSLVGDDANFSGAGGVFVFKKASDEPDPIKSDEGYVVYNKVTGVKSFKTIRGFINDYESSGANASVVPRGFHEREISEKIMSEGSYSVYVPCSYDPSLNSYSVYVVGGLYENNNELRDGFATHAAEEDDCAPSDDSLKPYQGYANVTNMILVVADIDGEKNFQDVIKEDILWDLHSSGYVIDKALFGTVKEADD